MNAKEFVDVVRKASEEKTKSYDTTALVKRVEGDTLWVHIAGGAEETPVRRTVDAKAGDTVQIRVANGDAWAQGNGTAPPTDDTAANAAQDTADGAERMARTAVAAADRAVTAADAAEAEAGRAKAAADTAQETAESVHDIAVQASEDAAAASTAAATADQKATAAGTAAAAAQTSADNAASAAATADSKADAASAAATRAETKADTASAAASRAETAAGNAETSASTANRAANNALTQLGTVEKVVDTLNWISEHATYKASTDTEVVAGKYYFTRSGSGTEADPYVYTVVASPSGSPASQNYYEIDAVDEAVSNYISTHLALTDEGLWVTNGDPESTTAWKVLIKNDGVYIINENGATVAKYKDNITLGNAGVAQAIVSGSKFVLTNKNGADAFNVNMDGEVVQETVLLGDDIQAQKSGYGFNREYTGYTNKSATLISNELILTTDNSSDIISGATDRVHCSVKSMSGNKIVLAFDLPASVTFTDEAVIADYVGKAIIHATRNGEPFILPIYFTVSISEGVNYGPYMSVSIEDVSPWSVSGSIQYGVTLSTPSPSFSFGNAKATAPYQTAIGKYNDNNQNNAFEIGNGSASSRSNAFDVDWSGNTKAAGDITDGSGNVLSDKADASAIPTVNNATLTIQKNGTNVQTFTANASSNKTANITVPTKTSDITNDSGFITQDSNGDVSVTRNISAGGKATFGAINGDSLFDYSTVSMTSSSINANASGEVTSSASTKTNYYPIAITNVNISTGQASLRRFYFSTQQSGKAVVKIGLQNDGTSAKTISVSADILWVKIAV